MLNVKTYFSSIVSFSSYLISRIKASLLEQFCSNDYAKLWTCFEETLKRDPTCNQSLAKLISMHRNGYYSAEKLLEMIALHLDATYGEINTWKEFASCFLKISQCEEDRLSVCMDGNADRCRQSCSNHCNTIPAMFRDGVLRKNWTLRCKWWLTCHFRQSILASEVDTGDLELKSDPLFQNGVLSPIPTIGCVSHVHKKLRGN